MNKKEREVVFNMFGGRCAYCGCELGKRWNADHLEPLHRDCRYDKEKKRYVQTGTCQKPENDHIGNMMPSCVSCNITKSTMPLESFRAYIQQTVDSLNHNRYAAYKFAKKFGLVQETVKPVVFYFETITNQQTKSE